VHNQDGDTQDILWVVNAPFPLKDREFILHRRLCTMAAPEGPTGAVSYVRMDVVDNSSLSWSLRPSITKGALRVIDHVHMQVAWASVSSSGAVATRVRSRYREDPMTALPKWVVTMILDKMLPKGLAAMRKGAVEYDQRLEQCKATGSASAGRQSKPLPAIGDSESDVVQGGG